MEDVHINLIVPGDTILCRDGRTRTVTAEYIRNSDFMGRSIFGDCYNLGTIKVQRIRR